MKALQQVASQQPDKFVVAPTRGCTFGFLFLMLVALSALISGCAPVAFSIWTVVIFGAPHNFLEFRYFLSRLPSRFGPLAPFFITSFVGLACLFVTEAAFSIVVTKHLIDIQLARVVLSIWNQLLIAWILSLSILRYRNLTRGDTLFNVFLATVASYANYLSPQMFVVALIYLHPLMGLWILNRELKRTRKSWVKSFHLTLLSIPVAIVALAACLHGTAGTTTTNQLLTLSAPGSEFFTTASPSMLLAIYTFLQMVHYGVWTIAIPVATQGWTKWRLDSIPFVRNRKSMRPLLSGALGVAAVATVCCWLGFKFDYDTTIQLYLLVSLAHVLAEIPFLFWMSES